MSGIPSLQRVEADVWLDIRPPGKAFQLMVGLGSGLGDVAMNQGCFWLEFNAPDGRLLGWMRFEFQVAIKNQAVFAVTEWRPADGSMPRPEDVWLSASKPPPAGCADV